MVKENEIEIIDEVNSNIYTIPENEDIVFHPMYPSNPIL